MRDIGRGAAHVKTNHLYLRTNCHVGKSQLRRARHPDNTARRPRQNGVFSLKGMCVCQTARRLHEIQRDTRHIGSDQVDIAAQDGGQIRVNHRGISSANKLHQRTGAVRGADLSEPDLFGKFLRLHFMGGVTVPMHKDDGHAT